MGEGRLEVVAVEILPTNNIITVHVNILTGIHLWGGGTLYVVGEGRLEVVAVEILPTNNIITVHVNILTGIHLWGGVPFMLWERGDLK